MQVVLGVFLFFLFIAMATNSKGWAAFLWLVLLVLAFVASI